MTTALPLHPSLPPKPPVGFTDDEPSASPIASTSTTSLISTSTPLCALCVSQPAKYTCPGCSFRTCSLPCSTSHKAKTGCTGERNKAAYVPMNKYSWGTMVDDYVFLEEMGRRVGGWGKEIVKGGYGLGTGGAGAGMGVSSRGRGDSRGRGRGSRGRGGGRGGGQPMTRRDILKMRLESRDIDVDLLPLGMERRKLNQSSWDLRNQTALLTVEFKFHKPKDRLAPSSFSQVKPPDPPFTLTTHKSDFKKPLLTIIRDRLLHENNKNKKSDAYPQWVRHLVFPDDEDPEGFTNPQCVMATRLDTLAPRMPAIAPIAAPQMKMKRAYYAFDPTQPLATLLKHTHIVEFPTIEVWEEFEGMIVDKEGAVKQEAQRPIKRRRLNKKAGKIAIAGLIGGYGSSEEGEEEEDNEDVFKPRNVLAALGEYAGSDGEEIEDALDQHKSTKDEDGVDGPLDAISDDEGEEPEMDPASLLELMWKVRGGKEPWAEDEDEAVDWGDMDDDDEPE